MTVEFAEYNTAGEIYDSVGGKSFMERETNADKCGTVFAKKK